MENILFDRVHSFIDALLHYSRQQHDHGNHVKKICPVTGLDLSMQPPNTKFLSATGVKWYYSHDFKTFKKKLEPLLTEHWKEMPLDLRFREIAHAVRNTDSNPRNNTKRAVDRILSDKNTLFDNSRLIDKNRLKEAGLELPLPRI